MPTFAFFDADGACWHLCVAPNHLDAVRVIAGSLTEWSGWRSAGWSVRRL